MNLLEIVGPKTPAEFEGWICVPRGSIGPANVFNCWVFETGIAAARAAASAGAGHLVTQRGDYLPYYKTLNGLAVILQMEKEGLDGMHKHGNIVYAFGITEKSCTAAGMKAWRERTKNIGSPEPWIFQVPNSDPTYFDEVVE